VKKRTITSLGVAAVAIAMTLGTVSANASVIPTGPAHHIVGGKPSAEGAYPWIANLKIKASGGSYLCGGSQISPDIILTAAHCVMDGATSVTVDIGKINPRDAASAGSERTSTQMKFGAGPEKGDWAVLKLDRAYTPSSFPKFPSDGSKDTAPMFRAMGWGTTTESGSTSTTLREVDLPLVKDADCGTAAAVEICAGDLIKGGIDTCQGDSGGPLVVVEGGAFTLVGLTSWGEGCARPKEPGHYAKVSALSKDIKAAITALGGQQPA